MRNSAVYEIPALLASILSGRPLTAPRYTGTPRPPSKTFTTPDCPVDEAMRAVIAAGLWDTPT